MAKRIRYFAVDGNTFEDAWEARLKDRFSGAVLYGCSDIDRVLMMADRDDRIVGLAKLRQREGVTSLRFLEVAGDARGQKYGVRLLAEVFRRAARFGGDLIITPYTRLGAVALAPQENRLAARYYPQLQIFHEQYC